AGGARRPPRPARPLRRGPGGVRAGGGADAQRPRAGAAPGARPGVWQWLLARRTTVKPWRGLRMPEQNGADLGALSDLCAPWCVHVAATLRIADHIAAGRDRIGDLAAGAGCDPYALHRVLTHLVGKGVFEEPAPGRFALNQAARGLLDPS